MATPTGGLPSTGRGGMKIFIAGSSQSNDVVDEIAKQLREAGHLPNPWSGSIKVGKELLAELRTLSATMDGGVFVFGEDDPSGSDLLPRDNVVFEYGLFLGALGPENVCIVAVGETKLPDDFASVVGIPLPRDWRAGPPPAAEWERLRGWTSQLCPNYVRRFGFDLAQDLEERSTRDSVALILTEHAPNLMDDMHDMDDEHDHRRHTIFAVCSDKGTFSAEYYQQQFDWVKAHPAHSLRRVFVKRAAGNPYSNDEVAGILMHADQGSDRIRYRCIREDDPALGGAFSSSLGFALFGRSWILHWGLHEGFYHDEGRKPDRGTGLLLRARFTTLWRAARPFSPRNLDKLRAGAGGSGP